MYRQNRSLPYAAGLSATGRREAPGKQIGRFGLCWHVGKFADLALPICQPRRNHDALRGRPRAARDPRARGPAWRFFSCSQDGIRAFIRDPHPGAERAD